MRSVALRALFVIAAASPFVSDVARADGEAEAQAPGSSEGFARLVDALQNGSTFKIRATAAVALGRLGDPNALPALADAARRDSSYAVRAAACGALGRLADPAAIPALLDALHDDDAYVRDAAAEALERFHTPTHLFSFREVLRSDDEIARRAAVRAYGDVMREPQASPGLAALVVNALGDDSESVAAAAETALAALPHERAVPLLVDGLRSDDSAVRGACARLLEKRADPRAVEPLIGILVAVDETVDVRAAARAALAKNAEYVDVARYAAAATSGGSPERLTALRVLVAVNDSRAPALVERALMDADPTVRIGAARAAVDLGGAKARAALEAAAAREADPRHKRQLELLLKSMR